MKKSSNILAFVLSIFVLFFSKNAVGQENIFYGKTLHILELKESGDFDKIIEMGDDSFQEKVTSDEIEAIWNEIQNQLGKYIGPGDYDYYEADEKYSITQVLRFEYEIFALKVFFNEEGEVTGYFYQPAAPEEMTPPPDYADKALFVEIDDTIETDDIKLPAKLTKPVKGENFPVAILVHGSGPNDMDETIGPNKVFRDIAWGLASNGIAVLRYDKRTLNHANTLNLECFTLKEKVEKDVHSAIKHVKETDELNNERIVIIGHSLGGMAAPRIARDNPSVSGIVLMGTNSSELYDVLDYQYDYLFSQQEITEDIDSHLQFIKSKLQRIRDRDFDKETPPGELVLWNACFWKDVLEYDHVSIAAELKQPILVLQGERDYQIPMREFYGLRSALNEKENAMFKWYPGLNHLFIYGKGKSTPQEYSEMGNVSEEVIIDISNWIEKNIK